MNILTLFHLGLPETWRKSVRTLEFMFKEGVDELNCFTHNALIEFPHKLKEIEYDAIILGPTFLCNRYNSILLKKIKKEYSFIKDSKAIKIALPQDDYDCSKILEDWLIEWGVDLVYTVLHKDIEVLYPKFKDIGKIKNGYTGYISDKWINQWTYPKSHSKRELDVSYRASKLPPNFGSIGQLKTQIAYEFVNKLGKTNNSLNIDISVETKDMLPGNKWHQFIENSKSCLVTPSGSSILDPEGSIRECVNKYDLESTEYSFKEIENRCFKNQDKIYSFTAISPRNIEASLAETVQIATPGDYSELMQPMDHYILLEEDCSNIMDVVNILKDETIMNQIASSCKENFLSIEALRSKSIINEIVEMIRNNMLVDREKIIEEALVKQHDIYQKKAYRNIRFNNYMTRFKLENILRIIRKLGN